MLKKIFVINFVIISFFCLSQKKYEYVGLLKLNGNIKTVISYKLLFSLNNDKITGNSVTDLNGVNETKNSIAGTYNKKTKILTFNEDDILYTKSKFSEKSFCFINFSGKVNLNSLNTKLEGDFKGLYKNNLKCIDGNLTLIGAEKINKVLNKIKIKIQKTKKVEEKDKVKLNPIKILDSLKVNNLLKDQNLNVFINSENVSLEISDPKSEDGDIINLYNNEQLILDHYEIKNAKKKISIKLINGQNVIKIKAINEGERIWNTAEIIITDGERVFQLLSYLKKDDNSTITIIKN